MKRNILEEQDSEREEKKDLEKKHKDALRGNVLTIQKKRCKCTTIFWAVSVGSNHKGGRTTLKKHIKSF